jgi:acetyl esterase/lipase
MHTWPDSWALSKTGAGHDYRVYDDMPHAFMQMAFLPAARTGIRRMTDFRHERLGT